VLPFLPAVQGFFLAKHDASFSVPNQGRRFGPDTKEELSGLNQIMSYRI
jgi:hypothetical protein